MPAGRDRDSGIKHGERWSAVPRDRPARRHFQIAEEIWIVFEDTGTEAPTFGPCLVFYGPGVARRVRTYPAHWQELPDEQLYALSWGR